MENRREELIKILGESRFGITSFETLADRIEALYSDKWISVEERIVCAAIWYKELNNLSEKWNTILRPTNIETGIVICGHRHPHCMYIMMAMTGKRSVVTECGKYVQGFLTSSNRFVDRKEAAGIFTKLGGKLNYSQTELYSEDLY